MTATLAITHRTGRYSSNDPISHIWEAVDGDTVIGELYVSLDRHEIANVEVRSDRRGEGIARRLYETAIAEMDIYHAPVAHRTPEGHAFAEAMGGPTVEYDCDCYGCTEEDA